MRATLATILLLSMLFLVGCSEEPNEIEGTQRGAYSEVVVEWQGRKLHCVRFDTGTNNSDDSGISCDWVSFHGGGRE